MTIVVANNGDDKSVQIDAMSLPRRSWKMEIANNNGDGISKIAVAVGYFNLF